MNPIEGKRKVKVNLGGRASMDENGNVSSSKMLDMVVEGQNVYIIEPDGELLPLDSSAATPPSFGRTWFVALVTSIFRKVKSKATGASGEKDSASTDETKGSDVDEDANEDTTSMDESVVGNGTSGASARPVAKAGGRRRKAVRPKKKKSAKDAS